MFLFNGQIISSKKNLKNEIIKFEQLQINLSDLSTTTIKKPKIQETSTLKLLNCFLKKQKEIKFCNEQFKKEILPTLSRRIVIPLYIPVLSLICGLLLINSKKIYFNKFIVFFYGFLLLLFTELAVRYTGLSNLIFILFIIIPILLLVFFYPFLLLKFLSENKSKYIT